MTEKRCEITRVCQCQYKFFAETAYYLEGNDEDKKRAIAYLHAWKENIILKLSLDPHFNFNIIEEQFIDREALYVSPLSKYSIISLKLGYILNRPYELGFDLNLPKHEGQSLCSSPKSK